MFTAILGAALVGSILAQGMNDSDTAKALRDAVKQYKPEALAQVDEYLKQPLAISSVRAENEAPEAVAAQRNALRQLQQVSEQGYTPEEEAAIRQIQSETAATAASQRAATQEAFARRGISGGGAERVAAFQAASQAANRAGQQGLDVAAQAQRRAFQAMQAQGNLGTNVRGQAYGEAERRAQASDEARRIKGQAQLNVAQSKAGMKTGTAMPLFDLATQTGKQTAAVGTAFGTPLIAAGTDIWSKEKK
jgi:hypothetical protein